MYVASSYSRDAFFNFAVVVERSAAAVSSSTRILCIKGHHRGHYRGGDAQFLGFLQRAFGHSFVPFVWQYRHH
jgi:hypothetical protein